MLTNETYSSLKIKIMKKYLKTLIIGMLISSSPLLGNEIEKFQEVPQITKSKENGQEGKASQTTFEL